MSSSAGATESIVLTGLDFDGNVDGTETATLTEGGTVDGIVTGNIRTDASGAFNLGSTVTTIASAASVGSTLSNVAGVDISTRVGAQSAISVVDAAIQGIDSQRAQIGAVQNRLQSTISNLQSVSENVSAARSRIQDADFAAETASLTRNQILQQAGISVLAQANALPQQVLSLLQ